nr:glycosyl hydrolase family 18 protein [Acholeplasma laidlawii]
MTLNTSTNTWSNWAATSPSVFFPEIQSSYLNNPDYLYFFDNEAGVPYLVKKDGTIFISYDNERSIRLKSEYVIENGLGGLMFWEYGADTSGTLLQQMRTSLNK